MRTIIWFIYFWATLVFLIPQMKKAQRLKSEGNTEAVREIVGKKVFWWTSSLLRLAGAEVTVEGKEHIPDEAAVFVANHQGYFDIPVLLTSLDAPHALVAKKELAKLPLIKTWMELLDCVFIDRDNPRQAVTALKSAAENMTNIGSSFIIFPEGTRSNGGPLGEFKNGGFKVAFKADAPIVPVCIDGTHNLMKKNSLRIHPAKVHVTILPPIDTKTMTKEESKVIGEKVRQQISLIISKSA